MDLRSYLSGYADGEGCFCISINKSSRHSFGWDLRPSFSVSQNGDRAEVLEMFKQYFKCGSIRPDRSDKTVKYEVRSIGDLVNNVIPHFENQELQSSKRYDFEHFSKACRLMYEGKHHTKKGFNKIIDLAFKMNSSGKRKFTKQEVKI